MHFVYSDEVQCSVQMSYNEMPLMEFPPCTNQRPNICGIQINRDCNGVDLSKSVDLGPTGPCLWVKTFLVQLSKWTAMQNILKIIILRTKILSSHRIHG